jgi:Ca-activated chloride channel homolog
MRKRHLLLLLALGFVFSAVSFGAQDGDQGRTVIRRTVDLVELDVAVTDKKGNYVTDLRSKDFAVFEDGILQKVANFGEENRSQPLQPADASPEALSEDGADLIPSSSSRSSSASVFVLFDTSNYMYQGFVFAQDAITQFVRSLNGSPRIAFYSYSRDFSRMASLTSDRPSVLRAVRETVAGDDAALYDGLMLTLKDAARLSGRRVVVVFSNGPDNSSMVPPEDVREIAQSEGIPIYMVSTQEAKLEPVSTAVFERMSASTGGKAYFAKSWRAQVKAFASIRDDLAHLYSLTYYPRPNPNRGWRRITVKLVGDHGKKYYIRTRSGYRPKTAWTRGVEDSGPPG